MAVVGEQAVGGGGLVHLELVLGEAADERVGVRLEDRVQRLALRVARRDEPGRQIARVVGEAGRGEAGVPARLVARLQVRDVGGQQLAVPLEAMGGDQADPLLDPRVGRGRLGEQVVGAHARRRRKQGQEAERESAHAGRRGLGRAAEAARGLARSARRARAADGPPDELDQFAHRYRPSTAVL